MMSLTHDKNVTLPRDGRSRGEPLLMVGTGREPHMPYLFGDTDRAAVRLQVLAEVFAESSRAFLQDVVKMPPRLVLDLGCGPGYTTRLLDETTQCARAVGLEYSEHF